MKAAVLTSDRVIALLAALAILPAVRVPGFPLEVAAAVVLVALWRIVAGGGGGALLGGPWRVALRMLAALVTFVLLAGLTRGLMPPLAGMLVLLALTETLALIEEQSSFLSFLVILAASAQVTGAAFVREDPLGLALTVLSLIGLLLAALFFERRLEAERIPVGSRTRRIRIGDPRALPAGVLARTLGALLLGGFLLGGGLFVLVPRTWPFASGNATAGGAEDRDPGADGPGGIEALVGPNEGSKGIRLGDIGRIKLDMTPYFAVRMGVGQQPLLRENTYDVYREGNWTTHGGPDVRPPRSLVADSGAPGWIPFGTPVDEDRSFGLSIRILRGPMRRLYLERDPVRIRFLRNREVLRPTLVLLDNEQVSADFDLLRGDVIELLVAPPVRDPVRLRGARSSAAVSPRATYLELPRACAPLALVARGVVGEERNPWVRARLLVDWLRSDAFAYTLEMPPVSSRRPVVDFVLQRRRGHCEYFASALALMLRGLGHPARVARGFRGGDFMEDLGSWLVRGSNYHAWTEMYFEDLGWIALDATPADDQATDARTRTEEASEETGRGGTEHESWFAKLLGLDSTQARRVRASIERTLATVVAFLFGPTGRTLLGLLLGILLLGRHRHRRREAWRRQTGARTRRETVSPYHRALRALGGAGLHRRRVQTPREFLGEVATWAPEVEPDMGWLTRAHERERYGFRTPGPDDRAEATSRAAHVQGSVRRRRHRR